MATIGMVDRMALGDEDPCIDQFGMSDIAVEIATVNLRAELLGDNPQWTDSPTADPDHVERETLERWEWVRRWDEHVISQWHGLSLPHPAGSGASTMTLGDARRTCSRSYGETDITSDNSAAHPDWFTVFS